MAPGMAPEESPRPLKKAPEDQQGGHECSHNGPKSAPRWLRDASKSVPERTFRENVYGYSSGSAEPPVMLLQYTHTRAYRHEHKHKRTHARTAHHIPHATHHTPHSTQYTTHNNTHAHTSAHTRLYGHLRRALTLRAAAPRAPAVLDPYSIPPLLIEHGSLHSCLPD